MNFLEQLKNETNKTQTTNGADVFTSTKLSLLDFFSLGGSLREKALDPIELFSKAFAEDPQAAVRLAFYFRDVRGGQGQRDAFRKQMNYLGQVYPEQTKELISLIPEYGRWDDVVQLINHSDARIAQATNNIIYNQLLDDIEDKASGKPVSLLAKWMPSENASSKDTKAKAKILRKYLGMSSKEYRKMLTSLRTYLNVTEVNMSANKWSEIEYSKVPSKAMLIYKNAFDKRDNFRFYVYKRLLAEGKTKINAGAIYPHEIVNKILYKGETDPSILDPMWKALPDYIEGKDAKGIVVADVSSSMDGTPMTVSIALALYISERTEGTFKNHFITFSETPTLEVVKGGTIVEKVINLSKAPWGGSTNLESVFDLILQTAINNKTPQEEMPENLYIVSDMQFNKAVNDRSPANKSFMQAMSAKYKAAGYDVPFLIFWNVNVTNHNIPMTLDERGFLNISGSSPSIFKHLLSGKMMNPMDLVYEVVNSERYSKIKF